MFAVFIGDDSAVGSIAGNDTGSRPVGGSATWRGVMVGADYARNEGFQGDATLTADFAASNVDVAFTNIHEAMTGSPRNSIRFNDVPFTADGFSSGSRTGSRFIDGTFYGPNHAEVGGVFETDNGNKFGFFGAKRQEFMIFVACGNRRRIDITKRRSIYCDKERRRSRAACPK